MGRFLQLPSLTWSQRLFIGFAALAAFIICSTITVALFHSAVGLLTSETASVLSKVAIPVLFLAIPLAGFIGIWHLRLYILPYRFTVDKEERIAYYQWRTLRSLSCNLSSCEAIVVEPAYAERSWPFVVSAMVQGKKSPFFRSFSGYSHELAAFQAASGEGKQIAKHLSVPLRYEGWSPELIAETKKSTD